MKLNKLVKEHNAETKNDFTEETSILLLQIAPFIKKEDNTDVVYQEMLETLIKKLIEKKDWDTIILHLANNTYEYIKKPLMELINQNRTSIYESAVKFF